MERTTMIARFLLLTLPLQPTQGSDKDYGYGNSGYGNNYDGRRGSQYDYDDGYAGYGHRGRYDAEEEEDDRQYRNDPYNDNARYYDYDDREDYGRGSRSKPSGSSTLSNMSTIVRKGDRKIGLSMLGAGGVLTLLGISLFFNKSLLRLGNLLFIAGVPMTIGPGRTAGYFFQPKKSRATGCLLLGIFLVLFGHPMLGIFFEIFGLLNLFGNMFPVAMALIKQLPVVGSIFKAGQNRGGRRSRQTERYEESRSTRDSYDAGNDDSYYGGDSYSRQDDRYY